MKGCHTRKSSASTSTQLRISLRQAPAALVRLRTITVPRMPLLLAVSVVEELLNRVRLYSCCLASFHCQVSPEAWTCRSVSGAPEPTRGTTRNSYSYTYEPARRHRHGQAIAWTGGIKRHPSTNKMASVMCCAHNDEVAEFAFSALPAATFFGASFAALPLAVLGLRLAAVDSLAACAAASPPHLERAARLAATH